MLAVNCAIAAAIHRINAPAFKHLLCSLAAKVKEAVEFKDLSSDDRSVLRNSLTSLICFWFFKSVGPAILFSVVEALVEGFNEDHIELLLYVMHQVGMELRKADAGRMKAVLDMVAKKTNDFQAELNTGSESPDKAKKVKFLQMEMTDIRNNKGTV